MAQVKLDQAKIEQGPVILEKTANKQVLEVFSGLAQSLAPEQGQNNIIDQFWDACKSVQTEYNGNYLPATESLIGEFMKVDQIREYMEKKANIGSTAKVNTGYSAKNVNTDRIM